MPGAPKRDSKSRIAWTYELRTVLFLLYNEFNFDLPAITRISRRLNPDAFVGYDDKALAYRLNGEYKGRAYPGRAVEQWRDICSTDQTQEVIELRDGLKAQIRDAAAALGVVEEEMDAASENGGEAGVGEEEGPAGEEDEAEEEEEEEQEEEGETERVEESGEEVQEDVEMQDAAVLPSITSEAQTTVTAPAATDDAEVPHDPTTDPGLLRLPASLINTEEGRKAQEAFKRAWDLANR